MEMPPCRKIGNHDWAYGSLSQWCLNCWLVKPYRELRRKGTPRMLSDKLYIEPKRVERKQATSVGVLHAKPWAEVERYPQCHYCEQEFHSGSPPTFDHIIPVSKGGKMSDGWVLACTLCNNARGDCPYDQYLSAVYTEAVDCIVEGRSYRRPKYVEIDGEMHVSMKTSSQLAQDKRDRKRARRAFSSNANRGE